MILEKSDQNQEKDLWHFGTNPISIALLITSRKSKWFPWGGVKKHNLNCIDQLTQGIEDRSMQGQLLCSESPE